MERMPSMPIIADSDLDTEARLIGHLLDDDDEDNNCAPKKNHHGCKSPPLPPMPNPAYWAEPPPPYTAAPPTASTPPSKQLSSKLPISPGEDSNNWHLDTTPSIGGGFEYFFKPPLPSTTTYPPMPPQQHPHHPLPPPKSLFASDWSAAKTPGKRTSFAKQQQQQQQHHLSTPPPPLTAQQQHKPMATVLPFQSLSHTPTGGGDSSPGVLSDSGTTSPSDMGFNCADNRRLNVDSNKLYSSVARRSNEQDRKQGSVVNKTDDLCSHRPQNGICAVDRRAAHAQVTSNNNGGSNKKSSVQAQQTPLPNQGKENRHPPKRSGGASNKQGGAVPLAHPEHHHAIPPVSSPLSLPKADEKPVADFQKIKRKKKAKAANRWDVGKNGGNGAGGLHSGRYEALFSTKFEEPQLPNDNDSTDYDDDSTPEIVNPKPLISGGEKQRKALASALSTTTTSGSSTNGISSRRPAQQTATTTNSPMFVFLCTLFATICSMATWLCTNIFNFLLTLISNVALLSYHAAVDVLQYLATVIIELLCECQILICQVKKRIIEGIYNQVSSLVIGSSPPIGLPANVVYPRCCEDVIDRLYNCPNADAYSILGVTRNSSSDEIRCFYKRMTSAVKPEKKINIGCREAFGVLQEAFELISTDAKRREYNSQLEFSHKTFSLQVMLDDLRYSIRNGCLLHCECGLNHAIKLVESASVGRYCSKCHQYHSVKNGDIWIDSDFLGLSWTYYAALNNLIYDISKWAKCDSINLKNAKPFTHHVSYRLLAATISMSNVTLSPLPDRHICSNRTWDAFGNDIKIPPTTSSERCKSGKFIQPICCCSVYQSAANGFETPSSSVPCCFGGVLVPVSMCATVGTMDNRFTDPDRAKKAGRRRRCR